MDDVWTQFVVKPTMGASGFSVAQIVNLVSLRICADLVLATGVDGALIGDLPVDRLEPVNAFADACSAVRQFDWADIYLLEVPKIANTARLMQINNYADSIQQSRATIRVVDGEYLYIYVRSRESSALRGHLDLFEEPIERRLGDFTFPM